MHSINEAINWSEILTYCYCIKNVGCEAFQTTGVNRTIILIKEKVSLLQVYFFT